VEGLAAKLFGTVFSLAGKAWAVRPQHVRAPILARLNDSNPFAVIADNGDLLRAVRIAWVNAALEIFKAALAQIVAEPTDPDGVRAFETHARPILVEMRKQATDRRGRPDPLPLDAFIETALGGAAEIARPASGARAATPLDRDFIATLAAITRREPATIPTVFAALASDGLRDDHGGPNRTFGDLMLAALAATLKGDPNAKAAFQIDMANANRHLIEQVLATVQGIDPAIDSALRSHLETLRNDIAVIIENAHEQWLGIRLRSGADSPHRDDARIRNRPTELVVARYRVIPYLDRGNLLADALAWARATDPPQPQGRLYVAPGGFGKTRLAIELVATLASEGWRCGFLSATNAFNLLPGPLAQLMRADDARGVLLVLDYAEGQIERLKQVADAAWYAPRGGPPIRILALARSAEGWWPSAHASSAIGSLFHPIPLDLIDAPLTPDDRDTLFTTARTAFTAALASASVAPPVPVAQPPLDGRAFNRPLTVAMAAFLAARGVAPDPATSILQQVFQEERKHWMRLLNTQLEHDPAVITLHRLAAQLTLVQGATIEGATALIAADPRANALAREAREMALAKASTLYGVSIAGTSCMGPIEPDMLGEHAVMSAIASDRDGLLGATLRAALDGSLLSDTDAQSLLGVVARATRPGHDAITHQTATAAIEALYGNIRHFDYRLAKRMEAELPNFNSPLIALSVCVAERINSTPHTPEGKAENQNYTSGHLRNSNDPWQSLAFLQSMDMKTKNFGRRSATISNPHRSSADEPPKCSADPIAPTPNSP